MVAFSELGVRQAVEMMRTGELMAEALAEELLARCAAASSLNAFISLEPDRVRAAARCADKHRERGKRLGPLHGVPLVIKDNIHTADFPTTGGTPGLAAHRPKRNAPIVQQLLDAGAFVLGKTNLQELAYGPTNNNAAFGPARNPVRFHAHPGRLKWRFGAPRSPPGSPRPASAPIPAAPCACRQRFAGSRASVRPPCAGRRPA